jgi:cell division septation protein DedD
MFFMQFIRITLLLTLIAIFVNPAISQRRASADDAVRSYKDRNYVQAEVKLKEVVAQQQSTRRGVSPELYLYLADCQRYLNKMAEAAKNYDEGFRALNSNDRESRENFDLHYLYHGHVLRALGKYREAKDKYSMYAQKSGNTKLGRQFMQSCDFAIADGSKSGGFTVAVENEISSQNSDFGVTTHQGTVYFASFRQNASRAAGSSSAGNRRTGSAGSATPAVAKNGLFSSREGSNGFLSAPTELSNSQNGLLNSQGYCHVTFSPDGSMIAITANTFIEGVRQVSAPGQETRLYIGQVDARGRWSNFREFEHNGPSFSTGFASFTTDGNEMYFSSNRPGGSGEFDIYVTRKLGNNRWSTPENLGPTINSEGNEITPFIAGDDLYFSSDWHFGLGGFDLFSVHKTSGRWDQLTHLGNQLNSPYDDYGFVADLASTAGFKGYFVSNRPGGKGSEDIYSALSAAQTFTLIVRDAADGRPLANATIDLSACGDTKLYTTNELGEFDFQVTEGYDCSITIKNPGFTDYSFSLSTLFSTESRQRTIDLYRFGGVYSGKVIENASRAPLAGVKVTVVNLSTSAQTETVTDNGGNYQVSLNPNTAYNIKLFKLNYNDGFFSVNTEDGRNRNILGIIPLTRMNSNDVNTGRPIPSPLPTPGQPAPQAPGYSSTPVDGWAVQLASLQNQPDLNRFSKANSTGSVYVHMDNSVHKVRVGTFNSRAEAERALASLKSSGFRDAFIINPVYSGARSVAAPSSAYDAPYSGEYKIQLGAFMNPGNFNRAAAETLNVPIEQGNKNDLIVFRIGGLYSEQDARDMRSRAVAAGFKDAFILRNVNGEWVFMR